MTNASDAIEDKQDKQDEAPSDDDKTFTQAELDEIIAKRLAKAKSSWDREQADREKQAEEARRIESLQGEEKARAKYEADLKARDAELAETKRKLAVATAEARLSSLGLPVELAPQMIGADDDATDANILAVKGYLDKEVARQVQAGLSTRTPSDIATSTDADADIKAKLRQSMGLK